MIKVSVLKSQLRYNELLELENNSFLNELQEKLNEKFEYTDLSDYDCDLKLIFIQTGGSEGLFLENFDSIKQPYYFLTNGENNSLAASLEILTYLKTKNLKGEILHGDINYLVDRIKTLHKTSEIRNKLAKTRLGVIGTPSDWLIASVPNYNYVKEKLGLDLIDVNLDEVNKGFITSFNTYKEFENEAFDKEELNKATKVYYSLNDIIKLNSLDGFTIRCFDLLKSLKTTGCVSLAKYNSNGVTSSCEGDIMALISMHLVKLIFDKSSFQANPSRIDVTNNLITLAHCTIPYDMLTSYKYLTHFESGIGVSVKGELKCEKVTIFRLQENLKDYFITTGQIITNLNEENLCRTQIVVKLDSSVKELLLNPCGNHQIVFYGDYKDELETIVKELLK